MGVIEQTCVRSPRPSRQWPQTGRLEISEISHLKSSGGWKSKLKVSAGLCSLWKGVLPRLSAPGGSGQPWARPEPPPASVVPWLPFCVSEPLLFLIKTQPLNLDPVLIPCDLELTNYIRKDPISKYGHVLRFQVRVDGGGVIQLFPPYL